LKIVQLTEIKFTSVPEYYLSEDCLSYPFDKQIKDKVLLTSFWSNSEKIKKITKEIDLVYRKLLPRISDYLNTIHEIEHPIEYWERIIGFWLVSIISNILEKKYRVFDCFSKDKEFHSHVLKDENYYIPNTIFEYSQRIQDTAGLHLQIYSILLKKYFPNNILLNDHKFHVAKTSKTRDKSNFIINFTKCFLIKDLVLKLFFTTLYSG
jgi:putative transferase (TIGR04331 family)